jgi:dTDP-4-amino-4,6-dideoxygalactose transaminase
MNELGFNYRITDFQCALGISQLAKFDRFLHERRMIAAFYDEAFADD